MRNSHLSKDSFIRFATQDDNLFDMHLTQYIAEKKKILKKQDNSGWNQRYHIRALEIILDDFYALSDFYALRNMTDKNFRVFLSKIIYPIASRAKSKKVPHLQRLISRMLNKNSILKRKFVELITQNNNLNHQGKVFIWTIINELLKKGPSLSQQIPSTFTSVLIKELQKLAPLFDPIRKTAQTKRAPRLSLVKRRNRPENLMNTLNYCGHIKNDYKIDIQKKLVEIIYLLSDNLTNNAHTNMNILKEIHNKITLSKDTKRDFLIFINSFSIEKLSRNYHTSLQKEIAHVLLKKKSLKAKARLLERVSFIRFANIYNKNRFLGLLNLHMLLICKNSPHNATNITIAEFIAQHTWEGKKLPLFSKFLLRCFKSQDKETLRTALKTLNLSIKRRIIPATLIDNQIIDTLLKILENEDADLRLQSLYVFRHLSENSDTKAIVKTKKLFDILLIKVKSPNTLIKTISMQLLWRLSTSRAFDISESLVESLVQTSWASIDSENIDLRTAGLRLYLHLEEGRTRSGVKNDELVNWCQRKLKQDMEPVFIRLPCFRIISYHATNHNIALDQSLLKPVVNVLVKNSLDPYKYYDYTKTNDRQRNDHQTTVKNILDVLLILVESHKYENNNANKDLFAKMVRSNNTCYADYTRLSYIKLIKVLLTSHRALSLPLLQRNFFGGLNNLLKNKFCDEVKQQVLYILLDLKKDNMIKDMFISNTMRKITKELCKHENETIKKSAQSFFEMIKPNTISQDGKNNHGLFGNKRKRVEDTSQEAPTNSRPRLK